MIPLQGIYLKNSEPLDDGRDDDIEQIESELISIKNLNVGIVEDLDAIEDVLENGNVRGGALTVRRYERKLTAAWRLTSPPRKVP